jgi:BTB/POZ domain-containing protein 9
MDQKDWVRVIDHTHFYCRSWQYLYFEPRVVQYARIVGTHNTVNKVFHVVALEAVFVQKPFVVERGIIGVLNLISLLFFRSE